MNSLHQKISQTSERDGEWIHPRFALHALLDSSQSRMNGLLTHKELSGKPNLLRSEYARWTGILKIPTENWILEIPWREDSTGEKIFLPTLALKYTSELVKWIEENPEALFGATSSLIGIRMPRDERRAWLLRAIGIDFSARASSPLKHDVVDLLAWTEPIALLEELKSSSTPHSLERGKRRRYNIGNHPSWNPEVTLLHHRAHYGEIFTLSGIPSPHIDLTLSGKSANTAVIRMVSQMCRPEDISVLPGYFFLNESDFPPNSKNYLHEWTRAFFASVVSTYAGMDQKEYSNELFDWIKRFTHMAQSRPGETFYICLDATVDIAAILEWPLNETLKQALQIPHLHIILTSSLTKYNRQEPNYHFGLIAQYAPTPLRETEKSIVTSYGGLSPLAVLHFPRIKKKEFFETKAWVVENAQDFERGLLENLEGTVREGMIIEHHTAYCYIWWNTPAHVPRNQIISRVLDDEFVLGYRGSSFYLEDFRICDVPEISCSRFSNDETRPFRNTLRVSYPRKHDRSAYQFGETLAKILSSVAVS